MANILAKYGIKEVADVMFYQIDEDGEPGAPVLYLDSLKVSTIEQAAEESRAEGGKGNSPLIIWDFGKDITLALTDALFSAKSMAIMFGDGTVGSGTVGSGESTPTIMKTIQFVGTTKPTTFEGPQGKKYTVPDTGTVYGADGKAVEAGAMTETGTYFYTFNMPIIDVDEITISADTFPGTYYITGDTYARSEISGRDSFFQFIVPKAKLKAENTITLEAAGDPSTFNLSLTVLRAANKEMMKLVKYDMDEATDDPVVPGDGGEGGGAEG